MIYSRSFTPSWRWISEYQITASEYVQCCDKWRS